MTFADSSFFIALVDPDDQWHSAALRIAAKDHGTLKVTDLVVSESVTGAGARRGGKPSRELFEYFVDDTEVLFSDMPALEEAMVYHTKFDGRLSVSDCLTVAKMVESNDRTVISFDSDFDKVRGISRIR